MRKPPSAQMRSKTRTKTKTGESLESIFHELKGMLAQHAPPFKLCEMQMGKKKGVQLVVPKPVVIPGSYAGKPVNAQLAAAIIQKDFVGFYYMCMYMNEEVKKKLSPALLKLLKGKACFHVTALDGGLRRDIEAALELGTRACRRHGWLQ